MSQSRLSSAPDKMDVSWSAAWRGHTAAWERGVQDGAGAAGGVKIWCLSGVAVPPPERDPDN